MLRPNSAGGYRFLGEPGRPFSDGVIADAGYDLVHARFETPLPLVSGLAAAVRHVQAAGRPVLAIAGFELRIPEPLTREGFSGFNQGYVARLKDMGLHIDGFIPAARTNVAPLVSRVTEPSVYAVSYTVPGGRPRPAYVMAGAPEEERGDPTAMLDSIMSVLSTRMDEIGASWEDATQLQLYGELDIQSLVVERVLKRVGRAGFHGIHWFPSRPPIEDLELEIDVRSAGTELALG